MFESPRCHVYLTNRQAKVTWERWLENRLRVLRAERGWSQAELGGRVGVSRQAVNAIETGKHDPSLPLAFKIARLFELPIEDIFSDGSGSDGTR